MDPSPLHRIVGQNADAVVGVVIVLSMLLAFAVWKILRQSPAATITGAGGAPTVSSFAGRGDGLIGSLRDSGAPAPPEVLGAALAAAYDATPCDWPDEGSTCPAGWLSAGGGCAPPMGDPGDCAGAWSLDAAAEAATFAAIGSYAA